MGKAGKKQAGKKQAGKKQAGKKQAGKKQAGIKQTGNKVAGNKVAGNKVSDNKQVDKKQTITKSRGQRKRLKRREAFASKMKMVEKSLMGEKDSFDQLDALKLTLEHVEKSRKKKQPVGVPGKSNKARRHVAVRELGQLKAVYGHPSFQSNAFSTIKQHLVNTIVPLKYQ